MQKGPARESIVRTYPSAVGWEVEGSDRPYRPDGLAQLAFLAFGMGAGFLIAGFQGAVGAVLLVVGACLGAWRFGPACERDPIFTTGRDNFVRISTRRDIRKMSLSQASTLATGYALAGILVSLFVRSEPAWGIGLLVTALTAFVFTMFVFDRIAKREGDD